MLNDTNYCAGFFQTNARAIVAGGENADAAAAVDRREAELLLRAVLASCERAVDMERELRCQTKVG